MEHFSQESGKPESRTHSMAELSRKGVQSAVVYCKLTEWDKGFFLQKLRCMPNVITVDVYMLLNPAIAFSDKFIIHTIINKSFQLYVYEIFRVFTCL